MAYYAKKGSRSKKTERDGIVFDSKLEADTYTHLKMLEYNNEISELKIQPKFELIPKGKRVCSTSPMDGWSWNSSMTYKADFSFKDKDGNLVVADSKGYIRATDPCKLRFRIFLYLYPQVIFLIISRKRENEPLEFHWYERENTK